MTDAPASQRIRYRYLPWICLGALAVIALLRLEVWMLPPYWDAAMGLWAQANEIMETQFDVRRHLTEEPLFLEGGYVCYRASVVPWIIACLMSMMDHPWTFLVYHFIVFAAGAVSFGLLYSLLRTELTGGVALLVSLAAFSVPVFNTQIDQLGLEVLLALVALCIAHEIYREHYVLASTIAGCSYFIKHTGFALTLAVTCHLLIALALLSIRPADVRSRRIGIALLVAIGALAMQLTIFSLEATTVGSVVQVSPLMLVPMLLWFPGLAFAMFIAIVSAWQWITEMDSSEIETHWGHTFGTVGHAMDRCRYIVIRFPVILYGWILVLGVCAGMFLLAAVIPRYVALVVPILYLLIGIQAFHTRYRNRWTLAIVGLLIFDLLNWSGRFLPPVSLVQTVALECDGASAAREGSILERSHEYLADLRATMQAAEMIDRAERGVPVIACAPFSVYLTMPRLGYVSRPIEGYLAGWNKEREKTFKPHVDLLLDKPIHSIFVRQPTSLYLDWTKMVIPPPSQGDEVLFDDGGSSPLQVYCKRLDRHGRLPGEDEIALWYGNLFLNDAELSK